MEHPDIVADLELQHAAKSAALAEASQKAQQAQGAARQMAELARDYLGHVRVLANEAHEIEEALKAAKEAPPPDRPPAS